VDIQLATSCSARRRRLEAGWPTGSSRVRPVKQRPDWICEILSPSNQSVDRVQRCRATSRPASALWLLDPCEQILESTGMPRRVSPRPHRQGRPGHQAEPFDAVESHVDELFGADPADD